MKFNWGTGILITIIVFIGAMIAMIVFSMNQQVNLVSPDYYPKGVNHEQNLQKRRNLAELGAKLDCKVMGESLLVSFPAYFENKKITGSIQFYFMTDYEKDIKTKIELDSNLTQSFALKQFEKGRYIIKTDWSDGQKSYYQEIDINL